MKKEMNKESRNSLKATNLNDMEAQNEDFLKKINFINNKSDYLKLKTGMNKLRLYPPHPGGKYFLYPYSKWWLPKVVEGSKEIKKNPILNAKIHGTDTRDIVEEYVKYVSEKIISKGGDYRGEIDILKHYKNGLKCKHQWICYADLYNGDKKEFGFLTISNGVKKKLNEIAISPSDVNSPILADPFTDPDDGKAIIISVNPDASPKDYYKVGIEFRGDYRLADEDLEAFLKVPPLVELFDNIYTVKDFDNAVKGLMLFDRQNDYNAFKDEEWVKIGKEMKAEYVTIENGVKVEKTPKPRVRQKEMDLTPPNPLLKNSKLTSSKTFENE